MECIRHQDITVDRIDHINRELDQDEQAILISPLHSSLLSPGSIGAFVFGSIWTVFSLVLLMFFTVGKNDTPLVPSIVLCVFVIIGPLIIASPFFLSKKAANTIVACTTKRVIVYSSKKSTSVPLKKLERISYVEYPGKAGHIKLGSEAFAGLLTLQSVDSNPDLVLARLPDVKTLQQILRLYCQKASGEIGPVEPVEWTPDALSRDIKTMIEPKLDQGESLIWAQQSNRFSLLKTIILPALALAILGPIATMIILISVIGLDAPPYLYALILIPELIFCIGIVVVLYQKINTDTPYCYIVTNKRIAIFHRLMFHQFEVTDFLPCNLNILRKTKRANGSGDLVFYQRISQTRNGDAHTPEGFLKVPHVDLAEQAVNNLTQAAQLMKG